MAVSVHDATPSTSGNSYTTSVDATPDSLALGPASKSVPRGTTGLSGGRPGRRRHAPER
jgi:hypothetical protein